MSYPRVQMHMKINMLHLKGEKLVCEQLLKVRICISCNMGRRVLPDMYAGSLRAYISGESRLPMLQVIYTYYFRHAKNLPKPKAKAC